MNRFRNAVIVTTAILLCAGCAAGNASYAKREDGMRTDSAYVAKVESIALKRGVEVHWVNPPRERDRRVASR